jgi:hypothetical protein
MFDIQSGWLRYHPFSHFQLPEIVQATRIEAGHSFNPYRKPMDTAGWDIHEVPIKAEFRDKKGEPKFTRGLYRLKWAGEVTQPKDHWDDIPYEFIERLAVAKQLDDLRGKKSTKETFDQLFHLYTKGSISVDQLFEMLSLPKEFAPQLETMYLKDKKTFGESDEPQRSPGIVSVSGVLDQLPLILPESLAYHLAVNAQHYFGTPKGDDPITPHPVGGLSPDRVGQVLTARFALDDQAIAALNYLRWMAEGHYRHPLLTGFDTMVRERLMDLSTTCTQMYFWMLQDYLYDSVDHYWVKADWKRHWHQLAGYLFWLGRTGDALVTDHAGINPLWASSQESFKQHCPDVMQGITDWDKEYNWGRGLRQFEKSSKGYIKDDPGSKDYPEQLPKCWGLMWESHSLDCGLCLKQEVCKTECVKRSRNQERVIKRMGNPRMKRTVLKDPMLGTVINDTQLGDIKILKKLSKPESSTILGDQEAIPASCPKHDGWDGEGAVQACVACPWQDSCSDKRVVRELPKGKDKASLCLRIAIKMNIQGSEIQNLMDLPDSQLEAIDQMVAITNNRLDRAFLGFEASEEEWKAIQDALASHEDDEDDKDDDGSEG